MMSIDPLSLFKVARDAPATSNDSSGQIDHITPSRTSSDPGERALAGMAAVSGSVAATMLPWFTNQFILKPMYQHGEVEIPAAIKLQGKTVGGILSGKGGAATSKVLGLFNVKAREWSMEGLPPGIEEFGAKLIEVQHVVDSFIDKHNLTPKGVTLNIQRGVLSSPGAPNYEYATKRVYTPAVQKELLLHELGHAADYSSRIGRGRAIAENVLRKGVFTALPLAYIAGDRIKEMIPGTIDDKVVNFMQENSPAIMGATLAATQLYPEAKASVLAIRHIAEVEGPEAARAAAKTLLPAFGSYLIGAVPAMVGLALARKYMREARSEKAEISERIEANLRELEKTSSIMSEIRAVPGALREVAGTFGSMMLDVGHVGKQIGAGSGQLVTQPGTMRKIYQAAKETGQSPEFIQGALVSALPATLGSLYLYATPGGKHIRERLPEKSRAVQVGAAGMAAKLAPAEERWREQHPYRFAGLVAMGAALSGGILSKFMHDLKRVL